MRSSSVTILDTTREAVAQSRQRLPRWARWLALPAAALLVAGVVLAVAVYVSPKPLLINTRGASRAVFDSDGRLLRLTLSSDEKYRLWTPLAEISPSLVSGTLHYEDRHFRQHAGVNPYALVRAALTTYLAGGNRTGGSTITMQLARLRFALRTRTLSGKLVQIFRALQLERHYTKSQLLEAYLNLAPYGENIEGAGAASLIYFGKPASKLSVLESLSLAVVPQNPVKRRPAGDDRNAVILKRVRDRLFADWAGPHDGNAAAIEMRLPFQAARRSDLPNRAPHFVDSVLSRAADAARVTTTLDGTLQEQLERSVRSFVAGSRDRGIANASIVLVDWRTMEVKALVGSADHGDVSIQGQVDGTRARRSPGSALKPFVYALAIDQGLIHPATILKDTPASFASYDPENFDRDFLGPISATNALVRSRNLPAVQLANQLQGDGFYGFLRDAGIGKLRESSFYGLSLTLGGVEVTLQELVQLYAMLAKGGELHPLVFVRGDRAAKPEPKRLLSPEAAFMVLDMLAHNPRPDEAPVELALRGSDASWKTGTSFGFRDAWAAGVFGQYVLGVWVGNFQGNGNPAFVGRESAGRLFFKIADAITKEGRRETVARAPGGLHVRHVHVCAVSGQLPGPHCKHLVETPFIPGKSPITTCTVHREVLLDDATGLRACDGQQAGTHPELYEFWPSDLLALYKQAGLPRRVPPPYRPECGSPSPAGRSPDIVSPQRGVVYGVRLSHLVRDGESGALLSTDEPIALRAVAEADVRKLYWFVGGRLVGSAPPSEPYLWKPSPGKFVVRVIDDQGRGGAREVIVRSTE